MSFGLKSFFFCLFVWKEKKRKFKIYKFFFREIYWNNLKTRGCNRVEFIIQPKKKKNFLIRPKQSKNNNVKEKVMRICPPNARDSHVRKKQKSWP